MTLSYKLQKLSQNKEFALNSTAVEFDEKLRKRFSKYFDLAPEADTAVTAAILTPNVKLNWLSVLTRTSSNVTPEIIITRALECISKFAVAEKLVPTKQSCSNHEDEIAFFDLEEINADEETTTSQSLGYSKVELESIIREQLYSYLANPIKNCAVWQKYDLLKQVSLYFNMPLTSSAPAERLFSFAGIINSATRNALNDFSFEKLLC
ncbi:uncharacterized protein LOC120770737 [Bactrocera tryoni]|uniref:uncharacterized protein LOC120770737 n=1 Tax=Bactrocera tryoni TaxID=59916 RepID=UPI001A95E853|nr:uncharacterized protein LOC120770737 [Bactrocera tryoni]